MPAELARRVFVVSPDPAHGRRLEAALATTGAPVEVIDAPVAAGPAARGPGAPEAALHVAYLGAAGAGAPVAAAGALLPRLAGGPVIAVLPRPDLAATIELMRTHDRVAAVLAGQPFDAERLAALAARLLADDLFGLEKVMPPGTPIHAESVADFQDKTGCMARLAALTEAAGASRRYREAIDQCIDELLMNALYDAPVDERGGRVFAGVSTRDRSGLRTAQRVAVQYAYGGRYLAVAVRDAFGSLDRATVVRHLHKGLHDAQPVERKAGGAGLGLYLMAQSSTALLFHVLPGIATEVICVFDLEAPKLELQQLAFLVQRDRAGRTPSPPARARPAGRGHIFRRIAAVALVLVVAGTLAAIYAWPRLSVRTVEPRLEALAPAPSLRALAHVELDSQPPGAAVTIDGAPAGTTPLALSSLPPGKAVTVTFERAGYGPATAQIEVPPPGRWLRHVQPLTSSDAFVRVRFVSTPPGAEVVESGRPPGIDRTYTPAEVLVEAGRLQRFTLTMPGRVPLVIPPFTPRRGERELDKGGDLVPGAALRIEATVPGKVTVSGAPHCVELALPAECTLAPGAYAIEYVGPVTARIARPVTMTALEASVQLELGTVEAAPGKRLQPGGLAKAVFPAGLHTISVSDATGTHKTKVTVQPGAVVVAD